MQLVLYMLLVVCCLMFQPEEQIRKARCASVIDGNTFSNASEDAALAFSSEPVIKQVQETVSPILSGGKSKETEMSCDQMDTADETDCLCASNNAATALPSEPGIKQIQETAPSTDCGKENERTELKYNELDVTDEKGSLCAPEGTAITISPKPPIQQVQGTLSSSDSGKDGEQAEMSCNQRDTADETDGKIMSSENDETVYGFVKVYTVDVVDNQQQQAANQINETDLKLTLRHKDPTQSNGNSTCLGSIIVYEPVEMDCLESPDSSLTSVRDRKLIQRRSEESDGEERKAGIDKEADETATFTCDKNATGFSSASPGQDLGCSKELPINEVEFGKQEDKRNVKITQKTQCYRNSVVLDVEEECGNQLIMNPATSNKNVEETHGDHVAIATQSSEVQMSKNSSRKRGRPKKFLGEETDLHSGSRSAKKVAATEVEIETSTKLTYCRKRTAYAKSGKLEHVEHSLATDRNSTLTMSKQFNKPEKQNKLSLKKRKCSLADDSLNTTTGESVFKGSYCLSGSSVRRRSSGNRTVSECSKKSVSEKNIENDNIRDYDTDHDLPSVDKRTYGTEVCKSEQKSKDEEVHDDSLNSDVTKLSSACRLCEQPADDLVQCKGSCQALFHAACLSPDDSSLERLSQCNECSSGGASWCSLVGKLCSPVT
jgi:hypothetical protein